MKCHFCSDQDCPMTTDLPRSPKIDLFQCPSCKSFYRTLANQEGALLSISWRVLVGTHEYFIKSYDGCTGNAPEFVIAFHTQGLDGKWYWEEIKRFDFVPKDWTPQNSAHKLKTYLPFL